MKPDYKYRELDSFMGFDMYEVTDARTGRVVRYDAVDDEGEDAGAWSRDTLEGLKELLRHDFSGQEVGVPSEAPDAYLDQAFEDRISGTGDD